MVDRFTNNIGFFYRTIKMLQPVLVLFIATYASAGIYSDRFLTLYNQITDGNNGYYSKEGVPYHSRENMVVETVDHGHETDSEALSYNVYLHAMYGAVSKNFEPFNQAWNVIENYAIPQSQYNIESFNPQFPVFSADFSVGVDPLHDELKATYGEDRLFLIHWLLDTDDNFGFGNVQGQCTLGPRASGPSFVHMGAGSVWQGITYPACDKFSYGGSTGFSYTSNIPNWHYNVAPDADARVIQAAYWASRWATQSGQISTIQNTLSKISKLGDYLRYSFYDVLYRTAGNCIGSSCQPATYKESAHYLLSWFIGWGGNINSKDAYSWRTGSSEIIIGYQNPVAAFAMVNDPNLRPKSPSGLDDWQNSLTRQVQLYEYLQTPEGALSGGVTNSWKNIYGEPPSDVRNNTFYGLFYENEPLMDDGTSDWFGMWTWSMDRLAQYYYITGDSASQAVLQKWFNWIYQHVTITDTSYSVPVMISWKGSLPSNTKPTVTFSGATFYGIASSLSRALSYYAAKSGDGRAKQTAKQLLDVVWANHKDDKGLYVRSNLSPFINMKQPVFIPVQGWSGTYPNGDKINATATFLDIRSWYKNDENWLQVEHFLNGGSAPLVDYHRFWEQADMALALGAYSLLFEK